jgi:DNA-directed RNA polymerase specialized sigma24 family protein
MKEGTTTASRNLIPCLVTNGQDFSRFYDYYAPLLYGYLLAQTTNAPLAQTQLEELFKALWQRRDTYNQNQTSTHPTRPLTWLLQWQNKQAHCLHGLGKLKKTIM